VPARGQHLQADGVVEAGGGGDLDGVDVAQHLAHGAHPGGPELLRDLAAPGLVGIHHRHELGVLAPGCDAGMVLPQAADAHDGHAQLRHGTSSTMLSGPA